MQSRWESLLESKLNTMSGFLVSWALVQVIYPLYGLELSAGHGFVITLIFTVSSILRNYIWRRIFNKRAIKRRHEANGQ